MNYTDKQLEAALAKMLPELLYSDYLADGTFVSIRWLTDKPNYGCKGHSVLDTELLHLCWLVEKDLNPEQKLDYIEMLGRGEDEESFYITIALSSDWRWRVAALAKVKSIDIV